VWDYHFDCMDWRKECVRLQYFCMIVMKMIPDCTICIVTDEKNACQFTVLHIVGLYLTIDTGGKMYN